MSIQVLFTTCFQETEFLAVHPERILHTEEGIVPVQTDVLDQVIQLVLQVVLAARVPARVIGQDHVRL